MQDYISCYKSCVQSCGTLFGCLGSYLPCCFFCCYCCCYPFVQIKNSQVGLKSQFGKFVGIEKPGLVYINPCSEKLDLQNIQTSIIDMRQQKVYTKDNIGVNVDTVCFYRVVDPFKANYIVNDLVASIIQITYVSLRVICGQYTLQELLQKRAMINDQLQQFVSKSAEEWGTMIERVLIKDMILSESLQKNLSIVSTTRRISESRIISAKADLQSAKLYREAADLLDTKAAMQIRFLETLTETEKRKSRKLLILPLDSQQPLDLNK